MSPRPLAELDISAIRAVFSDWDDTLTDGPQIHSATLRSLEELKAAGFWLGLISGRPAGWADCLMRILPVDVMVFENGAGVMTRAGDRIRTTNLVESKSHAEPRVYLMQLFSELKKEIPELKLATDQPFRLCDVAIDFAEEPPHLSDIQVEKILAKLQSAPEVTAKLSSIHVNYWIGSHTKVSAVDYLLATEGKTRGITAEQVLYSGDSPNDEPLFQKFSTSVGVANVNKFLSRMKFPPRYITQAPGGSGFQEIAQRLISK